MNNLIDWNTRLLPCMRGYITSPGDSVRALEECSARFDTDAFCMTADFDCSTESVAMFLLRLSRSQALLASQLPKKIKIKVYASVLLLPDLSETDSLEKLLFSSQKLLPIKLPITNYEDWMDLEFNHLLYRNKFRLLFTSFEIAAVLYPRDIIEKLMRISGAVFQFNYRSLTDPKVCKIIKKLIAQKSQILLGTSLDSLEKIYFYELDHYLAVARQTFSKDEYRILMNSGASLWKL